MNGNSIDALTQYLEPETVAAMLADLEFWAGGHQDEDAAEAAELMGEIETAVKTCYDAEDYRRLRAAAEKLANEGR